MHEIPGQKPRCSALLHWLRRSKQLSTKFCKNQSSIMLLFVASFKVIIGESFHPKVSQDTKCGCLFSLRLRPQTSIRKHQQLSSKHSQNLGMLEERDERPNCEGLGGRRSIGTYRLFGQLKGKTWFTVLRQHGGGIWHMTYDTTSKKTKLTQDLAFDNF